MIPAVLLIVAALLLAALTLAAASRAPLPPILSMVGILHNPGHLAPGMEGVVETQRQTFQYGAAVASHQFTFDLVGNYLSLTDLALAPGAWVSAKAAGSAGTAIVSLTIDSVATVGAVRRVLVTATLNAVPGAGKTTDVAVSLVAAGSAGA